MSENLWVQKITIMCENSSIPWRASSSSGLMMIFAVTSFGLYLCSGSIIDSTCPIGSKTAFPYLRFLLVMVPLSVSIQFGCEF